MQEEQPMTMETEAADEPQGIDGIIARVDSYIAKPEMITPETLTQLREELLDLKSILDPEEEAAPAAPADGLAGMIGGM